MKKGLYDTLVDEAREAHRAAAERAYDRLAIQEHPRASRQDYGPAYAAELVANGDRLARLLERCHDMWRACAKLYGPKRRPTYIFDARGMWGPESRRTWQDLPCRACEIEARDNHDPGDEDRCR